MTGKERAALRAQAHHLSATVHVGQHGLTLVKNADVTAKQAASELAEAVKAEVIQVIGRTTTLYRYNHDLEHGAGVAPAWIK